MLSSETVISGLAVARRRATAATLAATSAAAVLVSCGAADTAETPEPAGAPAATAEPAAPGDAPASGEASVAVYAGNGTGAFAGDGGPATEAQMFTPSGLALDSEGNLYISTDNRVRRVDAETGIITTVAGTGSPGSTGDGGPATDARLKLPEGLAVDGAGNLYIADADNGRIRRVDFATGIITTLAGGGIPKRVKGIIDPGDGGAATDAFFKEPKDVAVDSEGNVYFTASNRVRKVDANGVITTLAGSGLNELSGDGGPSVDAGVADPRGITLDRQGNIYFADTLNQRIRRLDAATGIITTVAGIGKHPPYTLPGPEYGKIIPPEGQGLSGDGGPASTAMLSSPNGVAIGPDGNLYIADTGNDRIRKVDLVTGVITTFADGGPVRGERLETGFIQGGGQEITFTDFAPPVSVAISSEGILFLADPKLNKVVRILP